MKGDRVDNKNSFKNLVMGRPDRRSIYLILCQPVLSWLDDSSHMIYNVPVNAF